MKHRILSISLLSALFLSVFASCGTSPDAPVDTAETAAVTESVTEIETTTAEELPPLPETDYEGYNFRILAVNSTSMGNSTAPGAHYWSDFGYNEERSGEPINDAVHARNMKIEEDWNIVITLDEVDNVRTSAQKWISAGDDSYDVICPTVNNTFDMGQAGYLIDYSDVPYIDMTADYWDTVMAEQLAIGGHLYGATGDISMEDEEYNSAVYFNKALAEQYNISDLYMLTADGGWTMDAAYEIGCLVTRDLDGNGELDWNDVYGLGSDYTDGECFFQSGGEFFAKLNAEGKPELTILSERSTAVMEKIISQFNDRSYMIWATTIHDGGIANGWTELNNMLMDNRLLMRGGNIYNCKQYRDMLDDFGILPYPKYDETQENYLMCLSTHAMSAVSLPSTVTDIERTGLLLEAIARASGSVSDAYYDVTLTGKFARDEESEAMLTIIFDAHCYDIGKVFGWGGFTDLVNLCVKNGGGFVSDVEAKLPSAEAAMEKTLSLFFE